MGDNQRFANNPIRLPELTFLLKRDTRRTRWASVSELVLLGGETGRRFVTCLYFLGAVNKVYTPHSPPPRFPRGILLFVT